MFAKGLFRVNSIKHVIAALQEALPDCETMGTKPDEVDPRTLKIAMVDVFEVMSQSCLIQDRFHR